MGTSTPRIVPTRTVEGVEDTRHIGFQPIQDGNGGGLLPSRTPPHGAESPPKQPNAHHMQVPHIGMCSSSSCTFVLELVQAPMGQRH